MTHNLDALRAGPASVPAVEELLASPRLARSLPPDVAADLLVRVAPLVAMLQVAATAPQSSAGALAADEVAARLKTTRGAVYGLARRADWRHFCTRPNRRTLRINEGGLARWLARQTPVAESLT